MNGSDPRQSKHGTANVDLIARLLRFRPTQPHVWLSHAVSARDFFLGECKWGVDEIPDLPGVLLLKGLSADVADAWSRTFEGEF